jgi:hypothetical protein
MSRRKPAIELIEHQCREAFQRTLGRLHFAIGVGDARRHLDPLVELAEVYLRGCGDSVLRESFREQLERARSMVSARHNLKVVQGGRAND